ncbi:hypothetical protein ACN4EG_08600 [Alkalinema pantanalense CENA528]|uniref:hypothetical protein n=1 Tax=Alkalinema pantanalense TaxID=1620705 RepID=UPI003D6EA5F3
MLRYDTVEIDRLCRSIARSRMQFLDHRGTHLRRYSAKPRLCRTFSLLTNSSKFFARVAMFHQPAAIADCSNPPAIVLH